MHIKILTQNMTKTIIFFLTAFLSLTATAKITDEGVSYELAQHRKSTINNLKYDITFHIPENTTENIAAEETISFTLSNQDSVIIDFRETADKIHEIKANGTPCVYSFYNEHIIIPQSYIRKGENKIFVRFTAGSQSLNRREGYVYTLFVPDRARTVFPCFEQPNLKGRFTLHLEVGSGWKAVTNTHQVSEQSLSRRKMLHFAETEPLSTYLFAFAAGEFQYQSYTEGDRTIGAYYRETDDRRVAQLPDIFRQVMFSLRWQEDFTDVPYPFAKYDLVILPGFQFGGMEHTGATFYNDNTIFLPPNPTPDEKLRRTELIAHETSHMWFGDAVTMDWFDDVWTKEVFANYFAAEITEPLFPDIDHKLNWLRTYQGAAISQDRTEGRTSIRQKLDNMRYAGLIYNNIIYNKAPVMMRKMVSIMGKEAFRKGIQKYVKTYKYGNATWDDLISILDAETSADLKAFSHDWVETANWPTRKAQCSRDIYDTEYYGFTELSHDMLDSLTEFSPDNKAEVMAAMMTLNENYLARTIDAKSFINMMYLLAMADDPLICSSAIRYMAEPLQELQAKLSSSEAEALEKGIWEIASRHPIPSVQTQAIRLLTTSAVSPAITDSIYSLWKSNDSPLLSVNDYMTMAYELAIRMPEKADSITEVQRSRISNPDRRLQFEFISKAVSPSTEIRDSLFMSFKKAENRRIEPWTASALYYLNHPLRQQNALKYIRPALEWLTDIQRTGDIFFPGSWCDNLLAGHRSKEAFDIVESYINENSDMLPLLRNKILSAEYYLKRAAAK